MHNSLLQILGLGRECAYWERGESLSHEDMIRHSDGNRKILSTLVLRSNSRWRLRLSTHSSLMKATFSRVWKQRRSDSIHCSSGLVGMWCSGVERHVMGDCLFRCGMILPNLPRRVCSG